MDGPLEELREVAWRCGRCRVSGWLKGNLNFPGPDAGATTVLSIVIFCF